MKRLLVFLPGLVLALAACASPAVVNRSAPKPAEMVKTETLPAKQANTEAEPSVEATVIPTTFLPKTGESATEPASTCSHMPLAQSILMVTWVSSSSELTAVNPATGELLCGFPPLTFEQNNNMKLSPEGKSLAVVDFESDTYRNGTLHLVDMGSWEAITTTVQIKNSVNQMAFDPAGTQVALVYLDQSGQEGDQFTVVTVDLKSHQINGQQSLDFAPRVMRFSPDGESLFLLGGMQKKGGGLPPTGTAASLKASDLSIAWQRPLKAIRIGFLQPEESSSDPYAFQHWDPGIAVSADGTKFYVVHADEEKLTAVDFANQAVTTVEIAPKLSWLERLLRLTADVAYAKAANGTTKQAVLSKDGQRLYVTGQTDIVERDSEGEIQFRQELLGLKVIEVATGAEVSHLDTETTRILPSPDGQHLFLQGWQESGPWIEVAKTESLEIIHRLPQYELLPTRLGNGTPALMLIQPTSTLQRMTLFDPEFLKKGSSPESRLWETKGYPVWVEP